MIRSLSLCFLALIFPSSVSWAQCDFRPIYSQNFRLSAFDVAIENNDLYVATGYGVALYDRSVDPAAPIFTVAVPGVTTDVQPSGEYVYAGSGSAVYVIRRTGQTLQRIRGVELGSTVHDLLQVGTYLYAATSAGVVQLDLVSRENPVILSRLNTTSGRAFSLAVAGAHLYAADGDNTVEIYTIQIPSIVQKVGVATAAGSVNALAVSGDRLYVSDGTEIEIFTTGASPARIGITQSFGGTALLPYSGNIIFTAGTDRRIRATDLSQPSAPVVLFDMELPASGGTVNRVDALASAGNRVYAAAGDLGLLTFDTTPFTTPHAVQHLVTAPARSVVSLDGSVIVAGEGAGIRQYNQSATGVLTLARTWDGSATSAVFDVAASRLLTGSGARLVLWDLSVAIPATLSSVTLPAAVISAVLINQTAYALLADRSVFRVDLTQPSATAARVTLSGSPAFITRGGVALAIADLNDDGSTTIRYFASGDPGSPPLTVNLDGSATSGIVLSDSGVLVAVTFRGLNVVDFRSPTPSVSVLSGSSAVPARDLFIAGNDLFVSSVGVLEVWDLQTRTLRRRFTLPASVNAVSASATGSRLIALATSSGITSVNYLTTSGPPALVPAFNGNRYYRRLFQSDDRVHLFDGKAVESFRLDHVGRPNLPRTTSLPSGSIDAAVIGETVFHVSGAGRVVGRDIHSGAQLFDFQISEGADASVLSLNAVGQLLYVSISKGCLAGACEKKTLILQQTGGGLVQTTALSGALVDFSVNGTRLYALFDDPDEIRVLSISNPLSPAVVAVRASEGNPLSIAYAPATQTVYTIGQKVFVYAESSLSKLGELLDGFTSDPGGTFSYVDQSITIVGGCVIVTGRSAKPQVFTISGPTTWTPVSSPDVPGPVRAVLSRGQYVYLLTDYSLEIWTSGPVPAPVRRRISR